MKRTILTLTIAGVFLSGCATSSANVKPTLPTQKKQAESKQDRPEKIISDYVKGKTDKKNIEKVAKIADKPKSIKEVKKTLLKTNPYYAKKHKKEALKEHIRVSSNAPLYRPPLFAQMYVMPYVSNDGIYHDVQKVWIKIKDGEFVLNTKDGDEYNRVFTLEKGLER